MVQTNTVFRKLFAVLIFEMSFFFGGFLLGSLLASRESTIICMLCILLSGGSTFRPNTKSTVLFPPQRSQVSQCFEAGGSAVPEYVKLPEPNNRAGKLDPCEKKCNKSTAHFLKVLHFGLEANVGNHVRHRNEEREQMIKPMSSSLTNSSPLTADEIECRRPAPNAEDQ